MAEENYIKVDGEPDTFSGGAIRYSKKGKGRFDLIPPEVVYLINGYAKLKFSTSDEDTISASLSDIIADAYIDDDKRYINTIIDMVIVIWSKGKIIDDDDITVEVTYQQWIRGFCNMLKDLAVHYEYGAEKYGVDNWKNGIPLTGGDRGGSFTDSGLRHLNQWMLDEQDEKHDISAVWNFFNAIYLQLQEGKPIPLHEEGYVDPNDAYDFGD